MAEPSASAPEENAIFGEVAQTGGGNWDLIGRKSGVKDPNAVDLSAPHRLKALLSIKIVRVATGCNSSHCVALSEGGVAYTWGRNEHGQLGHGTKSKHMNVPAKVSSLSSHKIVEAATGRNHTVFVTSEGLAFSCGMNKQGQLGQGTSSDMAKTPALMKLPTVHIVNAACGADFTMLLDRSGQVWSCGHPEYGALGHGTDNQTVAANKFIFTAQSTPKVIQALVKQKIKKIACGTSHTVVLDDKNTLFSWGFNGYGRLGHGNTADEMTPKQIKNVTRGGSVPIKLLACGGETTLVATVQNELYMCGRVKKTGDSWLALRAHQELNGWFVRSMSGGPGFMTVSADESVISWGTAFYGELGYGPDGAKSSVNPKKGLLWRRAYSIPHRHIQRRPFKTPSDLRSTRRRNPGAGTGRVHWRRIGSTESWQREGRWKEEGSGTGGG